MRCNNCGSENRAEAQFCATCGQPVRIGNTVQPAAMPAQAPVMPMMARPQQQMPMMMHQRARPAGMSLAVTMTIKICGGLAWIMVAIGAFMAASSYISLVNLDYNMYATYEAYGAAMKALVSNMGNSIYMLGIGAIFTSITRFLKNP